MQGIIPRKVEAFRFMDDWMGSKQINTAIRDMGCPAGDDRQKQIPSQSRWKITSGRVEISMNDEIMT